MRMFTGSVIHFGDMSHRIVIFPNGTKSVAESVTGEAMHSQIGPWQEAQTVYLDQSQLGTRLRRPISHPLVVYDLGLGIAANALVTLETAIETAGRTDNGSCRDLRIYSIESDLRGIRLALENLTEFPFLTRHRSKVETLLREGEWSGNFNGLKIRWKLYVADFSIFDGWEEFPELIYYDFYSTKVEPSLWGYAPFKRIYALCREAQTRGIADPLLLTYSSATAVRAALLLAGFQVGYGRETLAKRETTLATLPIAAFPGNRLPKPLDQRWWERFKRSAKPLPLDWPTTQKDSACVIIEKSLAGSGFATDPTYDEN